MKLLLAAALWAFLPAAVLGANLLPLAVTGYSYGGIVPNTAVPPYSSTASSLDLANDALFETGLPATTAGGLPASGMLTYASASSTYTFDLGQYGGSNLLRVNPTGTLTLSHPGSFTSIAVLGFSTQNNSPGAIEMIGDVTLFFSDGSSSVYSGAVDLSDWRASSPGNPNVVTSAAGGLVNIIAGTAAGAFEPTSPGPNFYVSVITLTANDAAKVVRSIGFGNFPLGGNTFQFIMAVSAATAPPPPPPVPAPSALWLAALGILFVGAACSRLRRAA